jgi:curved DNA-binding protein CbpA
MGNQNGKTSYDAYYESLKQNNKPIDPYEVLGVGKNFTWEELVAAYRHLAKLVHPDKGGSEQLFNTVTECFKQLGNEYKLREAEKPHHVLKQLHQANLDNTPRPTMPAAFAEEASFNNKFNTFFEENKLKDEDNFGYGHMMAESSKTREDIEIPRIMTKFNKTKFNDAFEKNAPLSKDVVIYKEPEPLVLTKHLQYTELGVKPDDFSTDTSKKANLHYSDYMKAHTTSRLVDPRAIQKRKEYRSVEDYEADRAQHSSQQLTEEELRHQKEVEMYKQQKEEERLRRLQEKDRMEELHYNKVNSLFLTQFK